MASIIYLLESGQRAAQSTVNAAIQNGYEIFIFPHFSDLLIDLKTHRPDAIVLNYRLLPETYDELRVISSYFTIIYCEKIGVDTRLNYYQSGINRVLEAEHARPDTIIRLINFHAFCKNELPSRLPKNTVQKPLKDFSLVNFLNRAVNEKKSATMKIFDDGWLARLKVSHGKIVHAWYRGKEKDDAILQLLHHSRGTLSFKEFSDGSDVIPVSSSTYGLIQEFRYEAKKQQEFLDKLHSENPVFTVKRGTGLQDETSYHFHVMSLIESRSSLKKILKETHLNTYNTIRTLQDLLKQEIIEIDSAETPAEEFSDDDREMMLEAFFRPGWERAQVLIVGSSEASKSEMISIIARSGGRKIVQERGVDLTDVPLGHNARLFFLGISMGDELLALLPLLTSQLAGCVFLIDFAQKLSFDYKKYFIRQFLAEYEIPAVIGVINVTKMSEQVVGELRKKLEIPPDIPVLSLSPLNFSGIKTTILGLTKKIPINE